MSRNAVYPMGIATLLIVFLVLVLVVLPIWVILRITALSRDDDAQHVRLVALENEVARLRRELADRSQAVANAATATPGVASPTTSAAPIVTGTATASPAAPSPQPSATAPAPVALPPPVISARPVTESEITPKPEFEPSAPPEPPPLATAAAAGRGIDWEQFMGAKLVGWIGGLAAFLAVAFFVKYSFEHDLIPPEVRVAIGFVLSAALIVGGLLMRPERFRITAQVLCASGIVSLYAVTFASHAVYHFAPFGWLATFALMALITVTAFLLAVRMEAPVVAILGLLGGFLTPILLSTGRDNPVGLFGYVALLDAGLIAVALHRRWQYLVSLAVAGTVFLQVGWAERFLGPAKAPVAVVVCLAFCAVFFAADEIGRALKRASRHLTASAAVPPFIAFGFALALLTYESVSRQPALLFSFWFAADLFVLALAWRSERAARLHPFAGGAVFALLVIWIGVRLTDALLPWALAGSLVFAGLHAAFPLVLARKRPDAAPSWWNQLYPPLALGLLLIPVLKLDSLSLLYWPAVLVIDAMAVVLALLSGSVVVLGVVLVLTLGLTAAWVMSGNPAEAEPLALLGIVALFSVFFFAAGLFVARRLGSGSGASAASGAKAAATFGDARAQVPAFAALLPFALLIMISQRLSLPDPSALFGLALLLIVLVLGLSRLLSIPWLPACGLAGLAALEAAWHARHFSAFGATTPLLWYLGFGVVFLAFPFVFRRAFLAQTGPWAVAALSGVVQFPLVYHLVQEAWPNDAMGLLPAAFAVPPLAALMAILRIHREATPARLNQLAWFGGVALLFVTLVFPIQFERQWLTLAWALEGVALIWLFHRVPHPGLRATGVVLLAIVFARLALNPAVLSYHPRSDVPVFNWYLYTYGVALVCCFTAARLLRPRMGEAEPVRVFGVPAAPVLSALGTVLAFLLLNIEIADYFATAGRTLTFEFRGNFARDMAYTVGWSLFALTLLGAGIWKASRAARYAALALLGVTLLKLFLHDLAHLGQLYRVGALVAVAAVAIVASFLYQRFVPGVGRNAKSR